jgi:hypothetical protein
MRSILLAAGILMLAACATQPVATTTTLASADAATTLAVGQELTMSVVTHPAPADTGEDPVIIMTLRHEDGRVMAFEEYNHAPMHVMAQAPGGPLAQTMGLFGEERPTLYGARRNEHQGEPFLCGPEGPVSIGYYEAPDGSVHVVGLKQQFTFETRPDGEHAALPYSPDQVCARLRFSRG